MTVYRIAKGVFSIVLALLVTVALIPAASVTAHPPDQDFAANLEPLAGVVQILSGSGDWQNVTEITTIHKGDQIRTADSGAAHLNTTVGITIDIYPSSLLELQELSLGTDDNAALTFSMTETVGLTHLIVTRKLKAADKFTVVTPTAIANIRGTQFYTFVGRTGHTAIIGEEDVVTVHGISGPTLSNQPDNISYFSLNIPNPPPAVCTAAFLEATKGSLLSSLIGDNNHVLFRQFLIDFFQSNVNQKTAAFLIKLLGLPDTATTQDILDALAKFNTDLKISDFLKDFRSLLTGYFSSVSGKPMAPATCGNGSADSSETSDNCKLDTVDISKIKGNSLCETDQGESLLNSPVDCLPFGALLKLCLISIVNGLPPAGGPTATLPIPGLTPTATQPGGGIQTPRPSGVGL